MDNTRGNVERIISIFFILIVMVSCTRSTANEEIIYALDADVPDSSINEDNFHTSIDFEQEYANIIGRYYVYSFEVVLNENVRDIGSILGVTGDNIVGNEDIFFEIQHLFENTFLLTYNFPFFGSRNPAHNNRQFLLPATVNNRFAGLSGEMGGGGRFVYFYFVEDHVLVTFRDFLVHWDDERDIIISRQELRSEFIFKRS